MKIQAAVQVKSDTCVLPLVLCFQNGWNIDLHSVDLLASNRKKLTIVFSSVYLFFYGYLLLH